MNVDPVMRVMPDRVERVNFKRLRATQSAFLGLDDTDNAHWRFVPKDDLADVEACPWGKSVVLAVSSTIATCSRSSTLR